MATLDFWFDFASTYSYVSAMRIGALAEARGIAVRWRPFLLGPIFAAQGWETSPFNLYPAKGRYMWRDVERICTRLGLPFRQPHSFPQNSLLAARVALALPPERRPDFTRTVFSAQFGEGRGISQAEDLAPLLERLGLPAGVILAEAGTPEIKAALRRQTEEAQNLGLFGAPSFVTADGEMFWGNDRLDEALDWADEAAQAGAAGSTP